MRMGSEVQEVPGQGRYYLTNDNAEIAFVASILHILH